MPTSELTVTTMKRAQSILTAKSMPAEISSFDSNGCKIICETPMTIKMTKQLEKQGWDLIEWAAHTNTSIMVWLIWEDKPRKKKK